MILAGLTPHRKRHLFACSPGGTSSSTVCVPGHGVPGHADLWSATPASPCKVWADGRSYAHSAGLRPLAALWHRWVAPQLTAPGAAATGSVPPELRHGRLGRLPAGRQAWWCSLLMGTLLPRGECIGPTRPVLGLRGTPASGPASTSRPGVPGHLCAAERGSCPLSLAAEYSHCPD